MKRLLVLDCRPETPHFHPDWKVKPPVVFNMSDIRYRHATFNQNTINPVFTTTWSKIKAMVGL